MTKDPHDKLRYCWRCRKKLGRGPGKQVCGHCRTYNMALGTSRNYRPIADIEERVAYYTEKFARGLDLFEESPWRRLPGAHNRLEERQSKLAVAARRVAETDEVE